MRKTNTFIFLLFMAFSNWATGAEGITIICPYGLGGGSHQVTTSMAAALQKVSGEKVEVINKPGESGKLGTEYFMSLPHDGHTLLQQVDILPAMYATGRIGVDPTKDLLPLITSQITFSQIYIRSLESRFTDWDSLVRYAKANPGKLKIATVGDQKSMERINMALLEKALGLEIESVAFDKPDNRYMSFVRGSVDILFEQPGDVAPFLKRKLIKPVLTFLNERPSAFADVPSLKEVGVNMTPLIRFRGFYTHADAPAERVKYLQEMLAQAFKDDDYQQFNRKKYMHIIDSYRDTAGTQTLIAETIDIYRGFITGNPEKSESTDAVETAKKTPVAPETETPETTQTPETAAAPETTQVPEATATPESTANPEATASSEPVAATVAEEAKPVEKPVDKTKPEEAKPAPAAKPFEVTKDAIKEVQEHLTTLGFKPGPADGLMGGKTRNAITAYQQRSKLGASGKITEELLDHLRQEVKKSK